jgi:hypothetical protein
MKIIKENAILVLSFKFSLDIITYTEQLQASRKFNLSNQLFRSGTSIGANIREAQGAESKRDFIHKRRSLTRSPARHSTGWNYVKNPVIIPTRVICCSRLKAC